MFPTSLFLLSVPGSGIGCLFFDRRTLPARRSASKRSRFTDHGLLQDPRGRQTDRCAFLTRCSFRVGLTAPSKTLRRRLAAHTEDTMITVGNKQHGARGVYVGRSSPLGNPFAMQGEATRAAVIRDYADWLAEQLLDPSSPASREIHRLAELARKQDLYLVCWCAPKACHADIIKRTIEAINRE
jgi:hypothetical protein